MSSGAAARAAGRRLGVLGTLVWDRIIRDPVEVAKGGGVGGEAGAGAGPAARAGAGAGPGAGAGAGAKGASGSGPGSQAEAGIHRARTATEGWGGLAYSLAALEAVLPLDWAVVPFIRVGHDLAAPARDLLAGLAHVEAGPGLRVVPEPNNRVELRYLDAAHRTEQLSGGVSPWPGDDLLEAVEASCCDALYVNFISGFEMELATARRLRDAFGGPIHADLHSLFLGRDIDGLRVPRPLERWTEWMACFDSLQMNEREFALLAPTEAKARDELLALLERQPHLVAVTRGEAGSEWLASRGLPDDPFSWSAWRGAAPSPSGRPEQGEVPLGARPLIGDPTGCGDVWGATFFARLLAGDARPEAMRCANRQAARKVAHSGARDLHLHLSGPSARGDGE